MAPTHTLMRDSTGKIVSVVTRPANPMAPAKNVKVQQQPRRIPKRPFRLLDLPPEMRNLVYEKVLEIYPIAHISRLTSDRNLLTDCRLVVVSKQIRQEFLPMLNLYAPIIRTPVRNLNFSHIVAFFNRLSEAEVKKIESDTASHSRTMRIEMGFREVTYESRFGPESGLGPKLQRWLNRMDKPAKRGTAIKFEYKCGRLYGDLVVRLRVPGVKGQEEWKKIEEAFRGQGQRLIMKEPYPGD